MRFSSHRQFLDNIDGDFLVEGTKQCSLKGIEQPIILHSVREFGRKKKSGGSTGMG